MSVSTSEAEVHWRDFLASSQARGPHGVELVVSDAHGGLEPALDARLTGVAWQRCQPHPIKNALAFVPKSEMRSEVVADLRAVFDAPDRPEAERQSGLAVRKYRAVTPRLAGWLEANVPEGLAVSASPRSHRRRLRTSNMLERLDEELKRRTRVAGLFPNDTSLLRLVSLDRLRRRLGAIEPRAGWRAAWAWRWWLSQAGHRGGVGLRSLGRDGPLSESEAEVFGRVAAVLSRDCRASSAVECLNSALRKQQSQHRRMTRGMLDLKRLFWNCQASGTGHRRGASPYQSTGRQFNRALIRPG